MISPLSLSTVNNDTNSKKLCFSRSNPLSSTNSGCIFPPGFSFKAREKDGLLVS
uniref:Uncharacterized protein n=1 Tax=Malurus cyaneus samueli TaxID=2593467 RepID=A0A8C5U776_9PASS